MIKHIQCDIFKSGADVICHQVNCQGVMGSGIAKQVREKYPEAYDSYKFICDNAKKENGTSSLLGVCQRVRIDGHKTIINVFSQDRYGYDGKCYTDYDALKKCLTTIKNSYKGKTIAIPYLMGCGLGGGNWELVSKLIEDIFNDNDTTVLICEYNGG